MTTNLHCPDRQPEESYPEYAARVLGYVLTFGLEPLSLSQLDVADRYAQQIVTAQPGTHEPHHAHLDSILHTLRLRLAARMTAKRQQLAGLQRLIDQAYTDASQPANAQGGTDMAELSEQESAIKLLRAALMLIMRPEGGQDGGGGRGAKLIPPTPKLPNGGIALPQPPQAQRSRF